MTNIVVLNFAGSVGKTTLTKQLIVPFLKNPERIQIESINSSAVGADVELNSRQFRSLAEKLAISKVDRVIDIGGSNIESVLQQMSQMEGIEHDVHWWVVPVDERGKVITDTLNTVNYLINKLMVPASQIVVIANNVEYPDELNTSLELIITASKLGGFHFASAPVVKSDLFDLVKDNEKSIIDIAKDETDFNALIVSETDESKLAVLGRQKVHRRMARFLARNLVGVWASTPMCAALAETV